MTSQQELANFIRGVHTRLRSRAREIGAEAAWKEHCNDQYILEKYAAAMRELATVHWEKDYSSSSEQSRNLWIFDKCNWYFFYNGKELFLEKEKKMASRYSLQCDLRDTFVGPNISLLDVGSCYNPLSCFPNLKTTAIDLEPGCPDVFKCDFLYVDVGDQFLVDTDSVCRQLPEEGYNAVVFSLVLGYLPSPHQRMAACHKAVRLLKKGGLLLIISPDSNHASANSRLIKQWRLALASLGLLLLVTEKLKHLRCYVFAKAHDQCIVDEWLSKQKVEVSPDRAMAIPQDKNQHDILSDEETEMRTDIDNKNLAENFSLMVNDPDLFI